ncbi:hypothetical protein BH10ACT1_BH10ACT1_35780 [soil metagenome]
MTDRSPRTARSRRVERPPEDGRWALTSILFAVALAVALVPLAAAIAHASGDHYLPVGDDAFIDIRSQDVFSADPPLLGSASSVSGSESANHFNNPGPLYFDALAVPVTALGHIGLAVGVVLLNAASVVGIALFARRRGGPTTGLVAVLVTAVLCWSLGSSVLHDATQPSSMLLPFLLLLVLVWSVTCGDLTAVPWAAGVASLVVMTYVAYAYFAVILAAWAAVGLALHLRRERREDPPAWTSRRTRIRRTALVTGGVLGLCWAQSVWQQFTSPGDGNLTNLVRSLGDATGDPLGFGVGTRLVASVVALPPWWARPSFADFLLTNEPGNPDLGAVPSADGGAAALLPAVLSLALVAGVLAGCWWWARHRGDRTAASLVATAAVALFGGLVTAGRMPQGAFGVPTAHTFRWLWPLAAFVALAIAVTLVRRVQGPVSPRAVAGALAFGVLVAGIANLPAEDQGASEDGSANRPMQSLARQMSVLEDEGPLLITPPMRFAEPYSEGVWAELRRRDIPFVTEDLGTLFQVGEQRRYTGGNARSTLLLREGSAALAGVPGARRVALHRGLDQDEQSELDTLRAQISRFVDEGGLTLSERGRRGVASGRVQALPAAPDGEALLASGQLEGLIRGGGLVLSPTWDRRLTRYAELQRRFSQQTVALFLEPID